MTKVLLYRCTMLLALLLLLSLVVMTAQINVKGRFAFRDESLLAKTHRIAFFFLLRSSFVCLLFSSCLTNRFKRSRQNS